MYSENLQIEQNEILNLVDRLRRPEGTKGWSKFYGDVVSRIIAAYLTRHLPPDYKVIGPDVYIIGLPTEFDLLVADKTATPLEFSSSYSLSQLYSVIEVKMTGIFEKKESFRAKAEKIRDKFQPLVKENSNLKCAYIAVEEVSPIKETSYNYIEETRKALEPFPFFVLRNNRNKIPYRGQWESFVKFVMQRT